jgi:CDP-diacylglycerol--glycerol-3-phosphate 3-phosphatidyltransferase
VTRRSIEPPPARHRQASGDAADERETTARRRRRGLLPAPVKRGFPLLLGPLAQRLISISVRPNAITTMSAVVAVASGVAFGLGALRVGALCLLASGALDVLDGKVARAGGMVSTFGAFYDSVLDRVGEAVVYAGLAVYLLSAPDQAARPLAALAVLAALTGSLLVSYARARAEALRIDCRVGLGQRAERILGIGVPTLLFGAGPRGVLLLAITLLLAALSWVTVVQRVLWVYRAAAGAEDGAAGRADRPSKARTSPTC